MSRFVTKIAAAAFIAGLLSLAAAPGAEAAGCLKGAAVGGTAGHFVGSGHAVAGAAVGCVVGRHEANKAARTNANAPVAPQGRTNNNDSSNGAVTR